MSKKDSIETQLAWCNSTRVKIEEFEHAIISIANSYDTITNELGNTSVFGEFQSKIHIRQEAFREEMKKLRIQLHQENLDYVNKQSQRLQQELANLG